MSQSVYLITNNLLGCGVPEGTCFPCSGICGKTAVVSCSSLDHHRIRSHFKLRGLKCSSARASFVCDARRNPDFSRQNKHRYSRNRNRHDEQRDSFGSFEEDMFSSKNGPLVSVSNTPKSQATAAPGPKEKEIVELFRKVQARLRERAATKEEKKVEASQGKGKENGTVASLLKLLRKHSAERVKRSNGNDREKEFCSDQFEDSGEYNVRGSTRSSDLDSTPKEESVEINRSSVARPTSNFQRRSPVPRIKFPPVSYDNDEYNDDDGDDNVITTPVSSGAIRENQDQTSPRLGTDPEQKPDPKNELFYPDGGIADLSEDEDSDDSGQTYNDENGEEQRQVVQHDDLSALKLPELRALAKSRGIKGFSKMKKGELMELLSER